jgi:hypothetical protein
MEAIKEEDNPEHNFDNKKEYIFIQDCRDLDMRARRHTQLNERRASKSYGFTLKS